MKIDENSSFSEFPEHVDQHDIVVLLGNLIENAFGAFETADTEDKHIDISIEQNDEVLAILIEDNGSGISDQHIPRLYEKGFTVNKTGARDTDCTSSNKSSTKGWASLKSTHSRDRERHFQFYFR